MWELTQVEYSLTPHNTSHPLTSPSSSFTSQWYVSTRSLATGRWPNAAANISGVRPSWGLGGTWSIQDAANNLCKWTECWSGVLLDCMCACTTANSVRFVVHFSSVCGRRGEWRHYTNVVCMHSCIIVCACIHTCECLSCYTNYNTTQEMTHMHIRTEVQVTQFTAFSQSRAVLTSIAKQVCKSLWIWPVRNSPSNSPTTYTYTGSHRVWHSVGGGARGEFATFVLPFENLVSISSKISIIA